MEVINNLGAYAQANWVELTGFAFTIVCVWLNARENPWAWPVGNVAVVLYIVVFFNARLYADVGLQLFFLVSGFYGWYEWLFGKREQKKLQVIRILLPGLWAYMALGTGLGLFLYFFLSTYTNASLPELDAPLAAFSLVAQLMLARKILENWLLWIGIDLISVGMYAYKDLYPTALLYFLLVLLAIKGYLDWQSNLKASTT
jgi:nicotinamide mononucleotide transporter